MNRRGIRLTVFLVVAAILAVAVARFVHKPSGSPRARGKVAAPEVVGVLPVQTHDISLAITLTADIQAINQAAIYAQVSGYLDKITVRRGYHVKKGGRNSRRDDEVPRLIVVSCPGRKVGQIV